MPPQQPMAILPVQPNLHRHQLKTGCPLHIEFHCNDDSDLVVCSMQADAGAQAVQIFDSWASNLAPQDYDMFAGPYINQIVDSVKQTHPDLPLILYISGSGGLLERMAKCNVEVISIDGSVDMKDAIRRVGPNFAVQVCPDLGRSQLVCKVSSALLRLSCRYDF